MTKTAKSKLKKTGSTNERVENYEQLLNQIMQLPNRGPVNCPAPGCNHRAPRRQGLRVHFARKHAGRTWGRPYSINRNGKPSRNGVVTPRAKKSARGHKETHSDVNFCPCCGFSLTVLRAALAVAGGAR